MGTQLLRRLQDGLGRQTEQGGDLQLGDLIAAYRIGLAQNGLAGRVDGLAAEGVEACDKELFHGIPPLCFVAFIIAP